MQVDSNIKVMVSKENLKTYWSWYRWNCTQKTKNTYIDNYQPSLDVRKHRIQSSCLWQKNKPKIQSANVGHHLSHEEQQRHK